MHIAKLLAATAVLAAAPAFAQQTTGNSPVVPAQPSMQPGNDADPTQNAPASRAQPQTVPGQAAPGQSVPATGHAAGHATPRTTPMPGQAAPAPAAPAATPAPAASTTIAAALPTIPDHATLLRLVQAAQLEGQLGGSGPFTLLAPNDTAFSRLPAGTLDALSAPANRASLQTILRNHIIAGTLTEAQLRQQIEAGGGRATLNTLSGQPLTASLENNVVLFTDAVGNKSFLDRADLAQANGIVHSTNGVSLPRIG